jgi:hypothetical protein
LDWAARLDLPPISAPQSAAGVSPAGATTSFLIGDDPETSDCNFGDFSHQTDLTSSTFERSPSQRDANSTFASPLFLKLSFPASS